MNLNSGVFLYHFKFICYFNVIADFIYKVDYLTCAKWYYRVSFKHLIDNFIVLKRIHNFEATSNRFYHSSWILSLQCP